MEAMISFVDAYRDEHGVEPICKVIEIAPSTYHAHVARRAKPETAPARIKRDAMLSVEIRRVFDENFQVYGVRKVWRQLLREGHDVARCAVARLMKTMALQGVIRGGRVRTTVSDRATPCPLDHVNRRFRAPRPNVLWVSDFTYVATWTGFVYVAFVIDAYARRIVGWRGRRTPASCSSCRRRASSATPWSRHCTIESPSPAISSITPIAVSSTSRSGTRSDWPRPALYRPSAALATATTTRSPRRSTGFTRPR
jgi:putative transposase